MNAERSTTGRGVSWVHIPDNDMSLKLSLLCWKLGSKAKQDRANDNADLSGMENAFMRDYADMAMCLFDISRIGFSCACLVTRISGEPY